MGLNQGGITKVTGNSEKQILSAPELAYTLPCKFANTGVEADAEGKKIIKAGTPVSGSLEARDTAFVVASTTGGTSNATGIAIHDVDVTSGTKNAQVCAFGFLDMSKVDADVAALHTTAARFALGSKITYMK